MLTIFFLLQSSLIKPDFGLIFWLIVFIALVGAVALLALGYRLFFGNRE